jgi:DNA-binding response OmpR family regulator
MKVLLVEDDSLLGVSLADELRAAGHVVLGPVPTVELAREIAQAQHPTAAVIDLDLAREHGVIQLAQELYGQGVASLLLTYDRARARDCHSAAIGVLLKPVAPHDIAIALQVATVLMEGGHPPPLPEGLELFPKVQ